MAEPNQRVLLVSPNDFATTYGDLRHIAHITGDLGRLLNVALPTLAALTPPGLDVTIVDENAEPLDFSERWDLVGITGFPPQLERARHIAERFAASGATIVCGGTSASLSPERWRPFADTLVIGEAEELWPRVCADFLAGRLEPEYRALERPDLSRCVLPDYSGFRPEALARFSGGIVQTSRGCPFACDFCDAIVFAGRKTRYKPVALILAELDQLASMGMRYVYLADDNFGAHRRRSKEILRAIRGWNLRRARPMPLLTQLTIDLAEDDEFLRLAAEAGLTRVFIGLETPNLDSLLEANKGQNVRTDMRAGVRRFQEHGIEVLGGSVVGFDHDDLSVFERQLAFFTEIGVASVQVYPLNAPDGTPLQERMKREGRYIDWASTGAAESEHFSYFNSYTIEPAQMSIAQLRQGTYWLLWKLYDPSRFAGRVARFFEVYERSPDRRALDIPRGASADGALGAWRTARRRVRDERERLGVLARLLRHLLSDADEAAAFARVTRAALRSSHPHRWSIAMGGLLSMINTRRMLRAQAPGIERTPYPTGGGEPSPRGVTPDVDAASLTR